MDQTKKDTSMEAIVPMITANSKDDDGEGGGPSDANVGSNIIKPSGQTTTSKAADKKKPEIKMTKK